MKHVIKKVQLFEFSFAPVAEARSVIARPGLVIRVLGASRPAAAITASTIYRRTYHLQPSYFVAPEKVQVVRPSIPRGA